ncbi:acetyltransferase [Verrucomicrobia bacterium]|nr:acetyltransferase [Verrucomicrobiota bacterium]
MSFNEIDLKKPCFIFGAGGHAHVVIDAALCSKKNILSILDDYPRKPEIFGIPIVSSNDNSWIPSSSWSFVVAIGDNHTRAKIFKSMHSLGGELCNVVHPTSIISKRCYIGMGCVVLAGSIVNPEARVGTNVILNTGSTVDHHCQIGDHVHICPGVNLAGNVTIGEFSMIGTGAVVKPGVTIGHNCIVGAGAVVVCDLPDHSISSGVPAKVIRYQKVDPLRKEDEQN